MIDLFPDMDLETRAYLLLGLIGIIFFAGVLALGVGNAVVNVRKAKEYESTDMHNAAKPKEEAPKKTKKPKVEKPKREKKPLFKRKKEDAVEVMAVPAGYEAPVDTEVEEEEDDIVFTPTGFGETIDDELADDWLTGGSDSTDSDDDDDTWEDDDDSDWAVIEKPAESEQPEQKRSSNPSSPFGGGVEVDF